MKANRYKVVINHEEQYSIVPVDQRLSRGVKEIGKTGTSTECLEYIEEVWTDMTPMDKTRLLKSVGR